MEKNIEPLVSLVVIVDDMSTSGSLDSVLSSVKRQTYRNLELVFVGRGANEIQSGMARLAGNITTIKVLEVALAKDSLFTVFGNLDSMAGEYIIILGPRDDISTDYVRSMIGHAKKQNADIVIPTYVETKAGKQFVDSFFESGLSELPAQSEESSDDDILHTILGNLFKKHSIEALSKPSIDTLSQVFATNQVSITPYCYYYRHERRTSLKSFSQFNRGLEILKQAIIDQRTEYVSFDIFDTLVVRPFLVPSDLFYLLDKEFKDLDGKFRLEDFRNIRVKSEDIARSECCDGEDVKLEQIYHIMQREYSVEKSVTRVMMAKELEYEIKFCQQRQAAKELYNLAHYLGKKIIITSDMYLPKNTIKEILRQSGYGHYHKLYVSSRHGHMKATQNLYKHIEAELAILPASVVHIGDNYESDVEAACAAGWRGMHFPKSTEAMPHIFYEVFGDDGHYAQNHLGISTAYTIAMNKYFDNPFRPFNKGSVFNGSPYFMGYLALGVAMLGFTRWMAADISRKSIDSIVFLGRDGYLPKKIFDILRRQLDLSTESHYLPTSRKATVPLSLFGEANIPEVRTFNYRGDVTGGIVAALEAVRKGIASHWDEDIDFNKVKKLQRAFVRTYQNYFTGNVAIMDIGYSGRPEQIFSHLFAKPMETYFIYAGTDEAERRLGATVNIYTRPSVVSLREKMLSETGPSCIGYRIDGNTVVPTYDIPHPIPYHEQYALTELQGGAEEFVRDYLAIFSSHLDVMTFGDNRLAMQALDRATTTPTEADREIFRDILHEDDIAGHGTINLFDEYYNNRAPSSQSLQKYVSYLEEELASHLGIIRSVRLFAGNIKRRIVHGKNR